MKNSDLNPILFPVEKITLREATEGKLVGYGENEYVVRGFIDDEWRVLNCCSAIYNLKPNVEIFPAITRLLDQSNTKYRLRVMHDNYEKFYVDYVLTEEKYSVGFKDDVIQPRIKVYHSYNGKLENLISFGWFRAVCSNGLSIPVESKKDENFTLRFRHTVDNESNYVQLFHRLHAFLDSYAADQVSQFKQLQDRVVVDPSERILEVINAVGGRMPKKIWGPSYDTVIREMDRFKITKANDWIVYNAINTNLFDPDQNKIHQDIRSDLDEKALIYMINS